MTEAKSASLTAEQIRNRLKSLDMYETSVIFSMPDEGDYTTRELTRIMATRGKLQGMLKEAQTREAQS